MLHKFALLVLLVLIAINVAAIVSYVVNGLGSHNSNKFKNWLSIRQIFCLILSFPFGFIALMFVSTIFLIIEVLTKK